MGSTQPELNPLPPSADILQNIKLLFEGTRSGYFRSLTGFGVFMMMAAFFVSAGKFIFLKIFKFQRNGSPTFPQLNLYEQFSLYYLIGSLAASLLWFCIGQAGFLNRSVALWIGVMGVLCLPFSLCGPNIREWNLPGKITGTLTEWRQNTPWLEKLLSLIVISILVLFSTTAAYMPQQADTLITHIALPNFWINEGRMVINPYHFHSYLPSNTEILVTWALLFESLFAAKLLMWGYLVTLVSLFYGFLKRITNNFTALITVVILLSAPTLTNAAVTIKNDLPVCVFILAHYFLLAEAVSARSTPSSLSKSWIFLAGLLIGGAIGHKLIALPVAFISTTLLIGLDGASLKKKMSGQSYLIPAWFAGMILVTFPWFLRTYIETGNPLYPFLGNIFQSRIQDPLFQDAEKIFLYNAEGLLGVKNYFHSLLFGRGAANVPTWGPILSLSLLSLLMLKRAYPFGIRLGVLASFISSLALLQWLDVRYHIAPFTFLATVPFAFCLKSVIEGKYFKIYKTLAVLTVLFCFFQTYSVAHVWITLRSTLSVLISGSSPGNFRTMEMASDNMYWLSYLVNTRTQKEDGVLQAGIPYAYGIRRKMYFSSGYNKEVLGDLALESIDSKQLGQKLRAMDVRHLLISSDFENKFKNHPLAGMRIKDRELQKIRELLKREMTLLYHTPDKTIHWYGFKDNPLPLNIDLGPEDAQENPILFFMEAMAQTEKGQVETAKSLLKIAVRVPMILKNKLILYNYLAGLYYQTKDYDEALKYCKEAIEIHSGHYLAYVNMGLIYHRTNQYEQSLQSYKKAIELDPVHAPAYEKLGKLYVSQKQFDKAREMREKAESIGLN